MNKSLNRRIAAGLIVPWSGFVGSFVYYALLTALMLGGMSPDKSAVFVAYVAPFLAYGVVIAARLAGVVVARVRAVSLRGLHVAAAHGA